jgi:hypothetical protein
MAQETANVRTLSRDELPRLHRIASDTSAAGQRAVIRLAQIQLLCVVGSAVAGALGADRGWQRAALAAAAALFAGALATSLALAYGDAQRRWYGGRAAAESIKTLVWKYAMHAGSFSDPERNPGPDAAPDPDPNPDTLLIARLHEVVDALSRLKLSLADPSPAPAGYITPAMRAVRALSPEGRRAAYVVGRIEPEIAWYSEHAAAARRAAALWSAVGALAAVVGLAGAFGRLAGLDFDVLGIAAAAMAAAAAWTQLRQHGQIADSYLLASIELELVLGEAEAAPPGPAWARFVEQAESAISREHTLWLARRG